MATFELNEIQPDLEPHRRRIVDRFRSCAGDLVPPGPTFVIEPGLMSDYETLAQHHYKSGRPATAKGVFVARHAQHRVVQRFGASASACATERALTRPIARIVGVLVLSLPRLSCELRDVATAGRYTRLEPRHRAHMLNRELRTISRVVIDPRYRGLGLAVRMVRHALEHADTVYTEALAAMGRVNPFFERAGMTRYSRPPRPEHARLLDAMCELELSPALLASRIRLNESLEARGAASRNWFEFEVRRWAHNAFRLSRTKRSHLALDDCITLARDHLLASCVYYLHRQSDAENIAP